MKKISILLTFLATFAVASSAWASQPIGKVLAIRGAVQAVQMNGVVRDELTLSAPVYANEKIVTGASAKVQVVFEDKSLFTLGANSEVLLDKYVYDPKTGDGESILEVTKGVFKFLTGKIAKADPNKVKVNTPFATIGVRGSGGIVQVDPQGQTTLNMTECCLNIGARGSDVAPVELKQVNTFSRVSADGEVTEPKPAPMGMLMDMNKQVDLGDAEKAADPEGEVSAEKPKKKSSLKEMVKEKVEANSDDGEQQPAPEKVADSEPAPLAAPEPVGDGSLLAAFGSGTDTQTTTTDPVTTQTVTQQPVAPTGTSGSTTAQQSQTTTNVVNTITSGGGSLATVLPGAVKGRWLTDGNADGVDENRGEAVVIIDAASNALVLERKDNSGNVIWSRTITNGGPAPNSAKGFTDSTIGGPFFVYRGFNDKFMYVGSQPDSIYGAGNYNMVVGHEGSIDASNQVVDGQRYFFKFIPDYHLDENQVANFAYANGVKGVGENDGLGMVIDYTNGNKQFLAGSAKFGSDPWTGASKSSLRFVAGQMSDSTPGSQLMLGSVYSFDNETSAGLTTNEGYATSVGTGAFGDSPDAIAAYEMKFTAMTSGNEQTVYAVRDPSLQPNAPVNQADVTENLVGYSAGFYVEDVDGAGLRTVHTMANQNMNFVTVDREDASNDGVALGANFKYYRMDNGTGELNTGVADDTFRIGFGDNAAERAYVSHNVYGAETSKDVADYEIGSNFGPTYADTAYVSTDGAMLSSAFVELPTNTGIQEDCKSCEFVTWGVWAADIDLTGGVKGMAQLVPYVVGDVNKVKSWDDINGAGVATANYKGVLVGGISDGTNVVNEAGNFNMNVDFANRNVDFVGKIGDYRMYADETNVNTGAGKGFTGVSFDRIQHGMTDVSGAGQINGAFYGDQAQEVGGNFYFQDYTNSNSAAGIMAGKKQ